MTHTAFDRLLAGQSSPVAIGVMTFVATIALILAQPGSGVA